MMSAQQDELIDGVVVRPLTPHRDSRGTFTEIYRESWELGCGPVQFNGVTSAAGVLRGMHVHIQHVDHLAVVAGTMLLALHDVRPWSRTAGTSCQIEVGTNAPCAVTIPTGVAHGFYFPESSVLVYGVSAYWDPADEVACRWDSAELGLSWPTTAPILSERDAQAPDYAAFTAAFLQSWRRVHGALPDRSAS